MVPSHTLSDVDSERALAGAWNSMLTARELLHTVDVRKENPGFGPRRFKYPTAESKQAISAGSFVDKLHSSIMKIHMGWTAINNVSFKVDIHR